MSDDNSTLAISLFSEVLTVDQLLRLQLAKVLPKRMARDNAISAVAPFLNEAVSDLGKDHFKQILPILRGLRVKLEQ